MLFLQAYVSWLAARTSPPLTVGDGIVAGPFWEDSPELCTAVMQGGPVVNGYLIREEGARIQLLTRGRTHVSALNEAQRVFRAAAGATGYPLDGGWRLHATPQAVGPQWIGFDDRGRHEFSSNLTVQVRSPTQP